jgi:hypothetical protein
MTAQRVRRLIVVTLIAIFAVSLITLFSGGLNPDYNQHKSIKPVDTHELPPGLEGAKPGGGMGLDALGTGEGAWIQRADPQTGLLKQEFFYQSLTPQEQGVFEIVKPQARFYVAPWRVIHMQSDEGRFVAPDNHPLSGEFRKNIVVTVFQCEENQTIDLAPNSPHRLLEFHITDSAQFDTVQGEIKSDSDVELVTPITQQVTFKGKGMRLVYNELNRRIEYMEITHGKSLRHDPNARGIVPADEKKPAEKSATKKPEEPKASPLVQYYRVTFSEGRQRIAHDRCRALGGVLHDGPGGRGRRAEAAHCAGDRHGHAPDDRARARRGGGLGDRAGFATAADQCAAGSPGKKRDKTRQKARRPHDADVVGEDGHGAGGDQTPAHGRGARHVSAL